MLFLNVILMALISAAIVGLLVWSVLTQHRIPGYEDAGMRRRLRISVKFVPVDIPRPLASRVDPTLAPDI